jgi:hypothetical protein
MNPTCRKGNWCPVSVHEHSWVSRDFRHHSSRLKKFDKYLDRHRAIYSLSIRPPSLTTTTAGAYNSNCKPGGLVHLPLQKVSSEPSAQSLPPSHIHTRGMHGVSSPFSHRWKLSLCRLQYPKTKKSLYVVLNSQCGIRGRRAMRQSLLQMSPV